jgi:hypothetical protein
MPCAFFLRSLWLTCCAKARRDSCASSVRGRQITQPLSPICECVVQSWYLVRARACKSLCARLRLRSQPLRARALQLCIDWAFLSSLFAAAYDPEAGGVQPGVTLTYEAGGWLSSGSLLNPWRGVVSPSSVLVCDEGAVISSRRHGAIASAPQCTGSSQRVTAALVPEPGHEGGVLITWPITLGHTYTVSPLA